MAEPRLKPAVFLDRDGTLMEEVGYCSDPAKVKLIPGTAAALDQLAAAGYFRVIITNQAGIGRGYYTEADYHRVHDEFTRQLAPSTIDAVYFCPSHPDAGDPRRKPGTGMVEEAARDLAVDLARSWFVGDRDSDVECGQRAGLRTVLVATGYGDAQQACSPDFRAADITEATEIILHHG